MKSKVAGLWAKLGTFLGALVGILLVTGIAYGVGNQVFNAGAGIEIITDTASDLDISTQATTGGGVSVSSRGSTGSGIYVNTSNNDAIGTTAISYDKLKVKGQNAGFSLWLESPTESDSVVIIAGETSHYIGSDHAGGAFNPINISAGGTGVTQLYLLPGGNVGIGISPSYKLDVSGTGNFTGTVIVGTPTASGHAATKSYVDTVAAGGALLSRSGTSTYVTKTGDKVGIETGDPG